MFGAMLAWGPWGVFVLSVIDSSVLPIPEGADILVLLIAAQSARAGYQSAALAAAGSAIGSLFLFYLARKGGQAYLDARTQKGWPKRFRQWFHHYGALAIFVPVLIPAPLPMKVFVLSAGVLGMPPVRFLTLVFVARALRYFALAYLGAQMGRYPVHYLTGHKWQLLGMAVVVFLVLYAAVALKDYLRRRAHHHRLHHHAG